MKIIEPSFEVMNLSSREEILRHLEKCGRVCYKSEDKITDDSAARFIARLVDSGHESVLEHVAISVRIVCDRGVSHELVRHRIASYSQESTRYTNYSKGKFGEQITVIKPCFWQEGSLQYGMWRTACEESERKYMSLLANGATPQEARSVLPNSLKTEIIVTMNPREWRHFFRLRTDKAAHPQMREISCQMLKKFAEWIPELFGDLMEDDTKDVQREHTVRHGK